MLQQHQNRGGVPRGSLHPSFISPSQLQKAHKHMQWHWNHHNCECHLSSMSTIKCGRFHVSPLCSHSESEIGMLCLFHLISTQTPYVYLIYTQTKQAIWIGKILVSFSFVFCFLLFYPCNKCNTVNQCWGYHQWTKSSFWDVCPRVSPTEYHSDHANVEQTEVK